MGYPREIKRNIMVGKIIKALFIISLLLVSVSCSRMEEPVEKNTAITDNSEYYNEDSLSGIKELYVTVLKPNQTEPRYDFTLEQLNSNIIDPFRKHDPEVRVIFQEGVNGVINKDNYGYGLSDYNATMRLRGQSARIADAKSYKIRLNSKAPWGKFVTVNLNKHPFDDLRIRNKLAFELIKDVSDITSVSTQFVHLYVKDFSEGNFSTPYIDYGLFTHVENIDTRYLENHGLDKNGHLYKCEYFEFKRYEDIIKNVTDDDYDENDFEDILEIKGVHDHQKLIEMLDAVNNEFMHINDVIDTYFDRDNFITWLALNFITDNVDTQSRNYYLYSPSDADTWYFIPWDYDKGLGAYSERRPIWQRGLSNLWGNTLVNRFLRNTDNKNALTEKMEELKIIISQEKLDYFIELYRPIATRFLTSPPDNSIAELDLEDINEEFELLKDSIELNLREYYKSLERPMPVFLFPVHLIGNFMEFDWSISYDFQGDPLHYHFQLSDSPLFKEILYEKDNILDKIVYDKNGIIDSCDDRVEYTIEHACNLNRKELVDLRKEIINDFINEFNKHFYIFIKEIK